MKRPVLVQRGVVAIEVALLILPCFFLLPTMLYFARMTLHSIVLQQAAQNSGRYLASVPPEDMTDAARQAVVLDVAGRIVSDSVTGAHLDNQPQTVIFVCQNNPCSQHTYSTLPALVDTHITLFFSDPIFMGVGGFADLSGQSTLQYQARLPYAYR